MEEIMENAFHERHKILLLKILHNSLNPFMKDSA